MKKIDTQLLAIYILGTGIVHAIGSFILHAGDPAPDWFWRSAFAGLVGGTLFYMWVHTRKTKKK